MVPFDPKEISLVATKNLNFQNLLIFSAFTSTICLFLITLRMGPISSYSKSMNKCISTTSRFLSAVPGFQSAGIDGLDAMAVSLCNGSTPQKAENSSKTSN